jgi:hypothetical protein
MPDRHSDDIKVLLRTLIEAVIAEQKAKHRAFGLDASDLRAFSNIHRAQTGDKVTLPSAPEAKTGGWVDPQPLKPPPGIDIIDAMCDAQDARDRADRLREEVARLEALQNAQAKARAVDSLGSVSRAASRDRKEKDNG